MARLCLLARHAANWPNKPVELQGFSLDKYESEERYIDVQRWNALVVFALAAGNRACSVGNLHAAAYQHAEQT